jgi:hypothetical protein
MSPLLHILLITKPTIDLFNHPVNSFFRPKHFVVDKTIFIRYKGIMKIDTNTVDARLKIVGIKRTDLARKMGITRQRLSEMLLHSRSFNVVERLSRELCVPQRSLIDFEDGMDL